MGCLELPFLDTIRPAERTVFVRMDVEVLWVHFVVVLLLLIRFTDAEKVDLLLGFGFGLSKD